MLRLTSVLSSFLCFPVQGQTSLLVKLIIRKQEREYMEFLWILFWTKYQFWTPEVSTGISLQVVKQCLQSTENLFGPGLNKTWLVSGITQVCDFTQSWFTPVTSCSCKISWWVPGEMKVVEMLVCTRNGLLSKSDLLQKAVSERWLCATYYGVISRLWKSGFRMWWPFVVHVLLFESEHTFVLQTFKNCMATVVCRPKAAGRQANYVHDKM